MDKTKITMKELPLSERPYEKCMQYGAESLSDAELLAVVIRTGGKGKGLQNLQHGLLTVCLAGE